MKRLIIFTGFSEQEKIVLASVLFLVVLACIYLIVDHKGLDKIKLKPDTAFSLPCMKARELIVQEFKIEDNLWASRRMIINKMNKGDKKFVRITHIPADFSIPWIWYFTVFHKLTVRRNVSK